MTDSPTRRQPGLRTQAGEIIASGQRYAVTRDGLPDLNAAHLMFIAPEHQWRTEWVPEAAATVSLTREDHDGWSAAWLAPLGLLGLSIHAIGGRFRTVSATEFQAAADEVTDQMSRYIPDTWATVVLPAGFTLRTVSPAMVVGSIETHAQLLLAAGQNGLTGDHVTVGIDGSVGAGVYHRPSRDWLLVTAVHRDERGAVCGYSLADTSRGATHPRVPVTHVDLNRVEVPGVTVIWRDLRPGLTICWSEPPWHLDVIEVSTPDPDGMCIIDAVQGRFPAAAANLFTELTGELADLEAVIMLAEGDRQR